VQILINSELRGRTKVQSPTLLLAEALVSWLVCSLFVIILSHK